MFYSGRTDTAVSTVDAPMPPVLQEWGCDEELWAKVHAKGKLIRMADAGRGERPRAERSCVR